MLKKQLSHNFFTLIVSKTFDFIKVSKFLKDDIDILFLANGGNNPSDFNTSH